jgi:hypothetical protein
MELTDQPVASPKKRTHPEFEKDQHDNENDVRAQNEGMPARVGFQE